MPKILRNPFIAVLIFTAALLIVHPFGVFADGRISDDGSTQKAAAAEDAAGITLKVISYNIAAGQGIKNNSTHYVGTKNLDQLVKLMNAEKADLIGMQEVDDNRFTTRFVNEAKYISSRIGMHCFWHEASALGPFGRLNRHGNAVMSKYKILKSECFKYKSKGKKSDGGASTETRALSWALVDVNGTNVNFISTHLGFPGYARVGQAKELVEYVKKLKGPVIVVGDFNTTKGTKSYNVITELLDDTCLTAAANGDINTFPSKAPSKRIDFIFVSKNDFSCVKVYAGGENFKNASDHRPILAILKLKTGAPDTKASAEKTAQSVNGEGEGEGESTKILELQKSLFNLK